MASLFTAAIVAVGDVSGQTLPVEVPDTLRYALEENGFVFSGFKTFHAMREVGLSMLTDKGEIKPYNEFEKDVLRIDATYNRNWLNAEYNHAVGASQMAARWNRIEQDGDRYLLQYRTAEDEKVRAEHRPLNGITLPPSDPFWNEYLPPNGWGCRCTAVQVRRGKYQESDPEEAKRLGDQCTATPNQRIFRYNPGKTLKLFPPKHPYYKVPEPDKTTIKRIAEYTRLSNDPNYKDVVYDARTNGLMATNIEHNEQKENPEKFFNGQFTGIELEKHCQQQLFELGHSAILLGEKSEDKKGHTLTSLDMMLDGHIMDIKSLTGDKDMRYGYSILTKNKQAKKYNQRKDKLQTCDSVCLYFENPEMFDHKRMREDIVWCYDQKHKDGSDIEIVLKHIYVVVKGADKIRIYDI